MGGTGQGGDQDQNARYRACQGAPQRLLLAGGRRSTRPTGIGTLRYPARGIATLWEAAEPAPDGLAGLIGRSRAAILPRLATPATTGELAAELGVTPGAISQHLTVLREAGLVATQREGRTALHLRTSRATALF